MPRSAPATYLLALVVATSFAACLPENPSQDDGWIDGPELPGPLGCEGPCTLLLVSQTLDDRVDLYALDEDPIYRGAIDLDLKPNPGGDITGGNLDEPYGLAWVDQGLVLVVGHFPAIDRGSLALFTTDFLSQYAPGDLIEVGDWFVGGQPVDGVSLVDLDQLEPLFVHVHVSGRLLVGAFNNDLFADEATWTHPARLFVVDPETLEVERAADLEGCAGGFNLVPLDDEGEAVAIACDGNEGVAIADTSAVGEGSIADAAASITTCTADIGFPDKRVRHLAGDGQGGVVVVESTQVPLPNEETRVWRYDDACAVVDFASIDDQGSWDVRAIVRDTTDDDHDTFFVARADGDERGVYVLSAESGLAPTPCGRLMGIDHVLEDAAEEIGPHALVPSSDGMHLAIGAGPRNYQNAAPGHGKVLWAELVGDGCDLDADQVIVPSDSAPAVDLAEPLTWSRAPDQLALVELP